MTHDETDPIRFDEIDARARDLNGTRVVEIDGYHHVQPESRSDEYRRIPIVDLSEKQARSLYARLGSIIDDWEVAASDDE